MLDEGHDLKKIKIALVEGDGSAPEMMMQAAKIAIEAAKKDGIDIEFVPTPMGWNAFEKYGDTLPKESLGTATKLGLLFFGGVGDPEFDNTIGKQKPDMMPEGRCLLTIRDNWKLMVNTRPVIYYPELKRIAKVRENAIPDAGIQQIWLRFLLEDSYFGNRHLKANLPENLAVNLGVKLKHEINGQEAVVTDLAYYTRNSLEVFFRYAFLQARELSLPLISVDKANVMPRYVFWRNIVRKIHERKFPDVELKEFYVDNTCQMLFEPALLNGVIACGNEHGDILSDGAAAAVGSMGLMCSSAINPLTGAAMFESGAGSFPQVKGKDTANPVGRILTAALMLQHIGAVKGAEAIGTAVRKVLRSGFRTGDLMKEYEPNTTVVGTHGMGYQILSSL